MKFLTSPSRLRRSAPPFPALLSMLIGPTVLSLPRPRGEKGGGGSEAASVKLVGHRQSDYSDKAAMMSGKDLLKLASIVHMVCCLY